MDRSDIFLLDFKKEDNESIDNFETRLKEWKREKSKDGVSIYQLKVSLLETDPLVWRRIEIPSNTSLNNLSYAINFSMGWECYHLHLFKISGVEFGASDDGCDPWESDKTLKVSQAFFISPKLKYIYDFGDGWQHEVAFEEEKLVKPEERYPLCTGGENNCPPEDAGGISAFADYKEAILNKSHERHQEFLNWRGPYNLSEFSVEMANLRMIRKKVAKNLNLKASL